MKTRNDFVSNSSSCSFVIALPAKFSLNNFIEQTAKGCLRYAEPNEVEFSQKQDELNRAVLNYHLRASELLFLGSLRVDNITRKIDKQNNPTEFDRVKCLISTEGYYKNSEIISEDGNSKVVSEDKNSIILAFTDRVDEIAIKSGEIQYITGEYHWGGDYSIDPMKQAIAANKITKFARYYSDYAGIDYRAKSNSDTYFISLNTIWNTRALIAAGKDVVLDKWMDLDKLECMLKDGMKIFKVRVNNGGDGVAEDALYTFGGWEGEDLFNNMMGIDLLYSESM